MPLSLVGESAVVTGGASGNGRAAALALAEHGADVVVADRREEPREGGTPTHERIRAETDAEARFVECDVTESEEVQRAVAVADDLGGLGVMVNNAGIIRTGQVSEVDEEDFDAVFDVNVKGVFFGSKAAARSMRDRGVEGSIVNMSSLSGLVGGGGNSLYCASKGAVRLFTYALAAELGPHGIRVNAIHPGPVETKMIEEDAPIVGTDYEDPYKASIPLQRFGEPDDVADAVLYLASELSSFVTGTSLVLDGGISNTGGVSDVDVE
jgi:NAD(P)-dependent dehydrogenase (short-subunit alcohol dehydrogenase family)